MSHCLMWISLGVDLTQFLERTIDYISINTLSSDVANMADAI